MSKKLISFSLLLCLVSSLSLSSIVRAEETASGNNPTPATTSGNDPVPSSDPSETSDSSDSSENRTITQAVSGGVEQSSESGTNSVSVSNFGNVTLTLNSGDFSEDTKIEEVLVNWSVAVVGTNSFKVSPVFTVKLSDGSTVEGDSSKFESVTWDLTNMRFVVDLPEGTPVTVEHRGDDGSIKQNYETEVKAGGIVEYPNSAGFSTFTIIKREVSSSSSSSNNTEPGRVCDPADKNCDGILSCDEVYGAGYVWNENVQGCVFTGQSGSTSANGSYYLPATEVK